MFGQSHSVSRTIRLVLRANLSVFRASVPVFRAGRSVLPAGLSVVRVKESVSVSGVDVIDIRDERPADIAAVRDLNTLAFGQALEGRIVDALRSNGAALVSLVATIDGEVVGHIMYSPVSVGGVLTGAALGPMAVRPDHQRQGIGSRLVEAGNRRLEQNACPFVVVVGHSEFYPRFGFAPASRHGITCEWDLPDDVFMLRILDRAKMAGVSGAVTYRPEFSAVASHAD